MPQNDTSESAGAVAAKEKGGTFNAISGVNASGNVLTNDSDVDNATIVVSGLAGGSHSAATFTKVGTYGTLTLNENGSYSYVVNDSNPTVQALNDSDILTETFTYTIMDPAGLSDTAELTITINGANDAPVAGNDTGSATEKSGALNGTPGSDATGNVLTADTDIDNSNASLVVSAIRTGPEAGTGTAGTVNGTTQGAHGTLTINANGTYTYAVNESDAAVQALNVGQWITDTFTYTVMDPGGLTDKATLTITINGANDAPVGVDDTSAGAIAAVEKGGTSNGSGGVNASGNVLSNDSDVDLNGGSLAVLSVRAGGAENSGTAGIVGSTTVGAHGTLTLNANGSYTYAVNENDPHVEKLNEGDTLTDVFNYTVKDPSGATDTAVLTVTINGANDAPVAANNTSADAGATAATEKSGIANATAGANATGNVLLNDTDIDNVSGSLTVESVRTGGTEGGGTIGTLGLALQGLHGTLTLNANGTYTYVVKEDDPQVEALNAGEFITDTFNYTVKDPGDLPDTALLTITINGANDAADHHRAL